MTKENSPIQINRLDTETIDPNKLWVHYDDEADSLVIYLTGRPVRALSVLLDDDTYVKINPKTGEIVGFHIEAWERQFVPAHPDIQMSWNKLDPSASAEPEWSHIFHMLALWLIFLFKADYMSPRAVQFWCRQT